MQAADPPDVDATTLAAPSLVGIQRLSAVDSVRARIALAVDLGLLAPGERIPPVSEVAAALDVSEASVRRALEALTQGGVLVRLRGRSGGTLVADVPTRESVLEVDAYRSEKEHVHQLIDQRIVLDCGVAALAARFATKAQVTRLSRLVDRMEVASTWAEFHRTDERFHVGVAEAARLPGFSNSYCAVLHDLYRFYLPYPVEHLRESNREHRELVEAIVEGDVATATDVARRHVETLHRTMFVGLLDA
ncbi:MAG: FadR family transcriptional regulator [Actinobacteria bacterium]|nr:FadR family transcriptional regulator [Actinomycetota bacterium]